MKVVELSHRGVGRKCANETLPRVRKSDNDAFGKSRRLNYLLFTIACN